MLIRSSLEIIKMSFYKSVFDNHVSEGKKYLDFALKFSEVWFKKY